MTLAPSQPIPLPTLRSLSVRQATAAGAGAGMTTRGKHSRKLTSISELSLRALECVVPRGEYATAAQVHEWMVANMQTELGGRTVRSDAVRTSLVQHEPRGYVDGLAPDGEVKRWRRTLLAMRAIGCKPGRASRRQEVPPKHWMDDALLAWMCPCCKPQAVRMEQARLVELIEVGPRLAALEPFTHNGRQ